MKSKYKGIYYGKQSEDFDSDEELEIYCWLKEAEENNLIADVKYQYRIFVLCERASIQYEKQLKTKIKACDKFLFHPHKYTPDFEFNVIHESLDCYFINTSYLAKNTITIDVKGTFNKYGDPKQFSINQKWCWDKFDSYIEKIIPEKFFKKTWVPEIARLTPVKKQPVKKYIGVKTITEFIKERKDIS
jgi:hypothetical protein